MKANLYHLDDPVRGRIDEYAWPFVYLHGLAEDHAGELARLSGWIGTDGGHADDLFATDQPMPNVPGEYPVLVYGAPGIAVLAYPAFGSHYLCGRVALLCDAEGLAHARSPVDWC